MNMRVWEEIIKQKTMRWKNVNSEKELKVNIWDAVVYLN